MLRLHPGLDGYTRICLGGRYGPRACDLAALMVLLAALLVLATLSLNQGDRAWSGGYSLTLMLGGGDPTDQAVLRELRLPRLLVAIMVGTSIAMAGALLQALARNPLADPGLLGVSQGSLLSVMLVIVVHPEALHWMNLPLIAMTGGLGVSLLLLLVTRGHSTNGLALILMGMALETVLSSLSTMLVLYTPPEVSHRLSVWLSGSLALASWRTVAQQLPWCSVLVPLAILLGPRLRVLRLGNDIAAALGEGIGAARLMLLIVATLLSSASVVAVGPLAFLGILAPHLVIFLCRAEGAAHVALSGLLGACLVVGADLLTRQLDLAFAMPLSLAIVLIGAPAFIVVLRLRALRRLPRG